jgi:anti-sigma B factor antagonist
VGKHDRQGATGWQVPPEFAVTSRRLDDGGFLVAVSGELDLYTAPELERALLGAEGATSTTIDLSETTFIDSTSLHVLLAEAKRLEAAGGQLVVVTVDPNVLKVFELTGFDRLFSVVSALPGSRLPA